MQVHIRGAKGKKDIKATRSPLDQLNIDPNSNQLGS